MKALYLLLILLGLFIVFGFIIVLSVKKRKLLKSITNNPVYKDLMKLQELMAIEETENGQVQGGYGPYGLSANNPIPVKGVFGEISYLGRLRTSEGVKVEYRRLGSIMADNLDNPVDEYEIGVNGINTSRLFLYPCCKEMSRKAPEGYYLLEQK